VAAPRQGRRAGKVGGDRTRACGGRGLVYLGGWSTPNNLTPARFADAFEHVAGLHAGFRRNHAKGVGVSGFFENGNGVRLSEAVVFYPGGCRSSSSPRGAARPMLATRRWDCSSPSPMGSCGEPRWSNLPVFPISTLEALWGGEPPHRSESVALKRCRIVVAKLSPPPSSVGGAAGGADRAACNMRGRERADSEHEARAAAPRSEPD
jgi:hypothetical protein